MVVVVGLAATVSGAVVLSAVDVSVVVVTAVTNVVVIAAAEETIAVGRRVLKFAYLCRAFVKSEAYRNYSEILLKYK